jgi:glycosyltransferase involved in cell wall biosynthesis
MPAPSNIRVLHITNWYPTENSPFDGIWVKKQIECLPNRVVSDVVHLSVESSSRLKTIKTTVPGIRWQIPLRSWLLIEIITSLCLACMLLVKVKLNRYDLINFHIAYPLCVFLKIFRFFIKKPIIINEHWSAYHLDFGVKDPNRLSRVRNIFRPDLTLITVSKALATDICRFSGKENLNFHVVPNVVDTNVFRFESQPIGALFMASNWKSPKEPITALQAFIKLRVKYPNSKLRIAGDGPLKTTMLDYVQDNDLQDHVTWLGRMESQKIAYEMQCAIAFVHISRYETFSVVCAEAICCGTPVIASAVGGIPEFIDDTNGYLLDTNDPTGVSDAMEMMLIHDNFDRASIAANGAALFNKKRVGGLYLNAIETSCGLK